MYTPFFLLLLKDSDLGDQTESIVAENTTHSVLEDDENGDNSSKDPVIGIETNSVTQVPDSRLISTTAMNHDPQTNNGTIVTGVFFGVFGLIVIIIFVLLYCTKKLPEFCYDCWGHKKKEGKVSYSEV